jgi:hypothetical protein
MLDQHKDQFKEWAQLKIPSIRFDCGYDTRRNRAFFSEFSPPPPSSMVWIDTHAFEIVKFHAQYFAEQIWSAAD